MDITSPDEGMLSPLPKTRKDAISPHTPQQSNGRKRRSGAMQSSKNLKDLFADESLKRVRSVRPTVLFQPLYHSPIPNSYETQSPHVPLPTATPLSTSRSLSPPISYDLTITASQLQRMSVLNPSPSQQQKQSLSLSLEEEEEPIIKIASSPIKQKQQETNSKDSDIIPKDLDIIKIASSPIKSKTPSNSYRLLNKNGNPQSKVIKMINFPEVQSNNHTSSKNNTLHKNAKINIVNENDPVCSDEIFSLTRADSITTSTPSLPSSSIPSIYTSLNLFDKQQRREKESDDTAEETQETQDNKQESLSFNPFRIGPKKNNFPKHKTLKFQSFLELSNNIYPEPLFEKAAELSVILQQQQQQQQQHQQTSTTP